MPEVRLIDRQALLSDIDKEIEFFSSSAGNHDYFDYAKKNGLVIAKQIVGRQPTIEPEVRHGHWIAVSAFDACGGDEEAWMAHGNPIAYHYCSECKNETYLNEEGREILSDYCPFCGADMREVSEDE